MDATIHPIRIRKRKHRPGALPAAPALRNSTPERDARWLAALQEDSARRGLTFEQAAYLTELASP